MQAGQPSLRGDAREHRAEQQLGHLAEQDVLAAGDPDGLPVPVDDELGPHLFDCVAQRSQLPASVSYRQMAAGGRGITHGTSAGGS